MASDQRPGHQLFGVLPHRESLVFAVTQLRLYNSFAGRLSTHPNQAAAQMTHEFWLTLARRRDAKSVRLIFRHQVDLGYDEIMAIDTSHQSAVATRSRQQAYERIFTEIDDAASYIANSIYNTVLSTKTQYLSRLSLQEYTIKANTPDEFNAAKEKLARQHKLIDFYWALTIKNAYWNWKYPSREIFVVKVEEPNANPRTE